MYNISLEGVWQFSQLHSFKDIHIIFWQQHFVYKFQHKLINIQAYFFLLLLHNGILIQCVTMSKHGVNIFE